MKNLLLLLLLCCTFAAATQAQSDQFTVYVEGLTCPICSGGLESKFKTLKGISEVKADFKTGTMTFLRQPKYKMKMADVQAQVAKAGYVAKGVSVRRADGKTEKWGELKPIPAKGPGRG
jgi:copper chaperone CopZ